LPFNGSSGRYTIGCRKTKKQNIASLFELIQWKLNKVSAAVAALAIQFPPLKDDDASTFTIIATPSIVSSGSVIENNYRFLNDGFKGLTSRLLEMGYCLLLAVCGR
jgi:hypothetical protein